MSNNLNANYEFEEHLIANSSTTLDKTDFLGEAKEFTSTDMLSFETFEIDTSKFYLNGKITEYFYRCLPYLVGEAYRYDAENSFNEECEEGTGDNDKKKNDNFEDKDGKKQEKNVKPDKEDKDGDKQSIVNTIRTVFTLTYSVHGNFKVPVMNELFRYADKFLRKIALANLSQMQDYSNPIFTKAIHRFIEQLIEKRKLKDNPELLSSSSLNEEIDLITSTIHHNKQKSFRVNNDNVKKTEKNSIIDINIIEYLIKQFYIKKNDVNKNFNEDNYYFSTCDPDEIYFSNPNKNSVNKMLNIAVADIVFYISYNKDGQIYKETVPIPIYNPKFDVFSIKVESDFIFKEIKSQYDKTFKNSKNTENHSNIIEELLSEIKDENKKHLLQHSEKQLFAFLSNKSNIISIIKDLTYICSKIKTLDVLIDQISIYMYSTRQCCHSCLLLCAAPWSNVLDLIKELSDYKVSKQLHGIKKIVCHSLPYNEFYSEVETQDLRIFDNKIFENAFFYSYSQPIHWCSESFISDYFSRNYNPSNKIRTLFLSDLDQNSDLEAINKIAKEYIDSINSFSLKLQPENYFPSSSQTKLDQILLKYQNMCNSLKEPLNNKNSPNEELVLDYDFNVVFSISKLFDLLDKNKAKRKGVALITDLESSIKDKEICFAEELKKETVYGFTYFELDNNNNLSIVTNKNLTETKILKSEWNSKVNKFNFAGSLNILGYKNKEEEVSHTNLSNFSITKDIKNKPAKENKYYTGNLDQEFAFLLLYLCRTKNEISWDYKQVCKLTAFIEAISTGKVTIDDIKKNVQNLEKGIEDFNETLGLFL